MSDKQISQKPHYIQTAGGRKFQLWPQPLAADVHINDIAFALNKICRFGGHTKRFYAVTQHCLNAAAFVPWHLEDRKIHRTRKSVLRIQLGCLMHDAHEAYMGDLTRPLRKTLALISESWGAPHDVVAELADRIQRVIAEKLDLPKLDAEEAQIVDDIDNRMLATEKRDALEYEVSWGDFPLADPFPKTLRAFIATPSGYDPTLVSHFLRTYDRLYADIICCQD